MIQVIDSPTHSFETIPELREFINDNPTEFKQDVELHQLEVNQEGVRVGKHQYGLKESGLSSLLTRLRMPADYAYRIPDDLFIQSANRIIKESYNAKLTLNLSANNIRAIHSDKYMTITNKEIVESLDFKNKPLVKRIHIYDEGMSIALVSPKKTLNVAVGDDVQFGCEYNNSETGFGRFSLSEFLWRLICKNGAVMASAQSSVNQVHLGSGDNFDKGLYLKSAVKFLEEGADAYKQAFDKMRVTKLLPAQLNYIGSEIQPAAGKKETQELVKNWMSNETSVYGIFNDVTEFAHTKELPIQKRRHMEKVGGAILTNYRVIA